MMNKKLLNILFLISIIVYATSCKQNDDLTANEKLKNEVAEFEYIAYGTSFGECAGYCVKKVEVSGTKIIFEKKSWNFEEYPIVTITDSNNEKSWKELSEKVDYDNFQQLSPIIGCPDCADGGAEWLEIKKEDVVYKVIFEYDNEPEEVQSYIQNLRSLLESYKEQ